MNLWRLLYLLPAFATAGCTPGMQAAAQSAWQLLARKTSAEDHKLDPRFAYLRVTRDGNVGLLWQGSTERNREGIVEVYYGSGGEVLRLQDGRLLGAAGLPTEWRKVDLLQAPAWSALAAAGAKPVAYQRVRDVMPGYRAGVRDDLTVRETEPPSRSALVGVEPASVRWFEERSGGDTIGSRLSRLAGLEGAQALPPARYAVAIQADKAAVIYAEQCLARDLCFTWQRWSSALQAAVRQEASPTSAQ